MRTKILVVFGTRPEAIKMATLVRALLQCRHDFEVRVCVTAQHREMLDQVLDFFEIKPDYDLGLMRPGQDLFQLTASIITGMKPLLDEFHPDYVLVHGDTTTSTMAALAAFYSGAKIGHIEAGLRTYDKTSPFPEEMNRQLTGRIADLHFAPTAASRDNLLKEGVKENAVFVVGNTVIDALLFASAKLTTYRDAEIELLEKLVDPSRKLIVVTGHRRENFGEGFLSICRALRALAQRDDVQIIYPVHLNPNVLTPVYELLSGLDHVKLISPLAYPAFVWLMNASYLILTDSGGIQEEAPSLGKPVLVMRDTTERPEAVTAGTVKLVGTDELTIYTEAARLLDRPDEYDRMKRTHNPYGTGNTTEQIIKILQDAKTV